MRTVKVEFSQEVKYQGYIKVTEEQYERLLEEESNDIAQYTLVDGKIKTNDLYDLLSDIAVESNAYDWGELEYLEIIDED